MRLIRKKLASDFGPCLLLAVVAVAPVCLNTNVSAVPRFDGAGYAVLGQALATGRGYREINKPEAPPHDHFPPGYPFALAILWCFTGRSVIAAHIFSEVCTVTAVLLGWKWFRAMYPPKTALMLGLVLAINWTWGRIGGSIQSEPLFMVWELLAVLMTVRATRHDTLGGGVALGTVLAASMLTRHVGICIAVAVVLDLGLRGRWKTGVAALTLATLLVLPWVGWLLLVHHHTQLGLLTVHGLVSRIAGQALFYLQRLPDQITGPFVEVGTVFKRSPVLATAANLWAVMATAIVVWGWVQTLRTPRRRLVGMIAFTTLSLLLIWPFIEAGRFLIPLVPMLLVGLTEGLARVLRQARLKQPRVLAVTILLGVSIPYSVYSIVNGRAEAQRSIHVDFDAACQWIAGHTTGPGPVLTRHPGEVFWQTGHATIESDSLDLNEIDRLINRLGVTYLLIDDERYVNAGSNPLKEYVNQYPGRATLVWSKSHGSASVQVFEIIRSK
jgi:Dolichyl-phosphate-mannose-protein mannosyltransferase